MAVETLIPCLTPQFFDNNGAPLASGQLSSYSAGTSTPAVTYTDSTGGTPNLNPIILNARGECSVWIPPNVGYKFVLNDSQGNTIWTRDQVVNSQLITLYGGVDTGVVNAYILNFTANFTALTDGIMVWWRVSHTNTGPSTLNVNGLGVVPIVQQNGNALGLAAISANTIAQVIYLGGTWVLLSSSSSVPQTGSFLLTIFGTSVASVTATYSVSSNNCTVNIPYFSGTSSSNQFTLTGVPSFLQPANPQQPALQFAVDNGVLLGAAVANLQAASNVIVLYPTVAGGATGWTASGTKGLGHFNPASGFIGNTIVYPLT